MDGQNFDQEQNSQTENQSVEPQNVETVEAETVYAPNYQDNTASYSSQNAAYDTSVASTEEADKTPGLSIAGLVLGIISIVFSCCGCFSVAFGIAGLIMSIIGNSKKKTSAGTAGLICSIVGIVLSLILIIVSAVFSINLSDMM